MWGWSQKRCTRKNNQKCSLEHRGSNSFDDKQVSAPVSPCIALFAICWEKQSKYPTKSVCAVSAIFERVSFFAAVNQRIGISDKDKIRAKNSSLTFLDFLDQPCSNKNTKINPADCNQNWIWQNKAVRRQENYLDRRPAFSMPRVFLWKNGG